MNHVSYTQSAIQYIKAKRDEKNETFMPVSSSSLAYFVIYFLVQCQNQFFSLLIGMPWSIYSVKYWKQFVSVLYTCCCFFCHICSIKSLLWTVSICTHCTNCKCSETFVFCFSNDFFFLFNSSFKIQISSYMGGSSSTQKWKPEIKLNALNTISGYLFNRLDCFLCHKGVNIFESINFNAKLLFLILIH